ncbi:MULTISPECIES: AbfB domain-containing protein [Streptomyces]|uniref:AbfB domain-containing protein n=1 Tax=Streptomyces TaxID=1883 RepID=UPI0012FF543F|nr:MULTISPECIES: AbfB domain-containing protein [Streptomyces]
MSGLVIGSVLALALWFGGGGGPADAGAESGAAPSWHAAPRPTPSLPGAGREEPSNSPSGAEKTGSPSPSASRTSAARPAPSPSRTAGPSSGSRTGGDREGGAKEESGRISGGGASRTGSERSLRSVNYPDRYVRHRDGRVLLDPIGSPGAARDATFALVPGLADGRCHSFRTLDGRYLRHRDFRAVVAGNDGSRLFREDATFCMRQGAAGQGSVSFEAFNHSGRFLRHRNFELRLDPWERSGLYRADISFQLTSPLG